LGAAYTDAPAIWPSQPDRVSVFRLTLSHRAKPCMRGKPAPGSRSPPGMGPRRSAAMYGAAEGPGNVRRRLPARCSRTY
jgi:hypothetical protein